MCSAVCEINLRKENRTILLEGVRFFVLRKRAAGSNESEDHPDLLNETVSRKETTKKEL